MTFILPIEVIFNITLVVTDEVGVGDIIMDMNACTHAHTCNSWYSRSNSSGSSGSGGGDGCT